MSFTAETFFSTCDIVSEEIMAQSEAESWRQERKASSRFACCFAPNRLSDDLRYSNRFDFAQTDILSTTYGQSVTTSVVRHKFASEHCHFALREKAKEFAVCVLGMADVTASSAADRVLLMEQQKAALQALKQAAEAVHSELEGKEWIQTLTMTSSKAPAVTDAEDDRNREVALYGFPSLVMINRFLT